MFAIGARQPSVGLEYAFGVEYWIAEKVCKI